MDIGLHSFYLNNIVVLRFCFFFIVEQNGNFRFGTNNKVFITQNIMTIYIFLQIYSHQHILRLVFCTNTRICYIARLFRKQKRGVNYISRKLHELLMCTEYASSIVHGDERHATSYVCLYIIWRSYFSLISNPIFAHPSYRYQSYYIR